MARARNIKPGFFHNEELVELPFHTRLLFIGLWTLCDREGRLEDRPKRIKMALFPADDVSVDESLTELEARGFLLRYEVDGGRFIQVNSFLKHQNPHKEEKPSTIPAPCENGASTVQAPCKHSANTVEEPDEYCANLDEAPDEHSANRADSLIPDSPIAESSREHRASRLPDSWSPTDEQIAFCRTERPDLNPKDVAARFRDYWIAKAGKDGRKANWEATWRNWVRNERTHPPTFQSDLEKRTSFAKALTGANRERATPDFIDIN